MKNFRFSLETVLGYKQQVLDSLQNEHMMAMAAERRQEELLKALGEEYRLYKQEFTERRTSGISAAEVGQYENGLHYLERKIEAETGRLQELKEQTELARERMVEAKKETASLEKLREKKKSAHQKEAAKEEERLIDEFVNNLHSAAGA